VRAGARITLPDQAVTVDADPTRLGQVFANNFEGYRVGRLLEDRAGSFQTGKRLILLGYGNFRAEHEKAHALMDRLNVSHEYRDGPARRHDWHSGWVKEAVGLLLGDQ
jgi:hypothetical protein